MQSEGHPETHNLHEPLQVVCAIIEKDGAVLCAQRGPLMRHPGYWEFPGGKIQPNETPVAALKREILEELAVQIEIIDSLPPHTHTYPGLPPIQLLPFRCLMVSGVPIAKEHAQLLWASPKNLRALKWLAADQPIVEDYWAFLSGAI